MVEQFRDYYASENPSCYIRSGWITCTTSYGTVSVMNNGHAYVRNGVTCDVELTGTASCK